MSDLGLKDFSQLVSGAAILLSFFAGYKYALRTVSSTETTQTSPKKNEAECASNEGLRVGFEFHSVKQSPLHKINKISTVSRQW